MDWAKLFASSFAAGRQARGGRSDDASPHAIEFITLAPPHPASLAEPVLLAQCEVGRGRAAGPGGQHRNKVETKITIEHGATGIIAHASERRSQEQNRREAIFRLRLLLATHVRCPVPAGEIRTPLWRSRVSGTGLIACNPGHEDYPTMLALALDVLAASRWDPKKAALRLCCSPSQLLRFVKDFPHAWGVLGAARAGAGLHPLR